MLTKRPTAWHRIGALIVLTVLALGFVLPLVSAPSRADLPVVTDNPSNASRTVRWTMNTADNLTLQGVDLANGNASLRWVPRNVTWTPSGFVANGSLDANLSVEGGGITLRSELANHIADADFATAGPWAYENSAGANVTVSWNRTLAGAVFQHDSPKTESLWDRMDAITNWLGAPVPATIWLNTMGQHEGSGMVGLNMTLPNLPNSWAGVLRMVPVNWAGVDRLVAWVRPLSNSPLTFNVTAFAGSTFLTTKEQVLLPGWQEIAVNLTELGPIRDSLSSVTLRVNGRNVPATTVYFDDLRVGNAKRFDETARIRQSVMKANATTAAPGSAVLRVNWSVPSSMGIAKTTVIVNVSGPSGSAEYAFPGGTGAGWHTFFADVSAASVLPGLYEVRIAAEVAVDSTNASSLEARVDDVSLLFPNRHNGTYLSGAIPLGSASEFLAIGWAANASAPAAVRLALRSGNDSNPAGGSWTAWDTWTAGGSYTTGVRGSSYFQVRVDLSTTNASMGPWLLGMDLQTRHRSAQGSIVSGTFQVPSEGNFLHWRTLQASPVRPAGTSIAFQIRNGTQWQATAVGGDLSALRGLQIQWSAILSTSDGLGSPTLQRVELVYEYLGPATSVQLTTKDALTIVSGGRVHFVASALDEGGHVVSSAPSRFNFTTDDPSGNVGKDGIYVAGDPGSHYVTAILQGTQVAGTIQVTVESLGWTQAAIAFVPYTVAILAAAILGYAGREIAIRRKFAIDDLFLISKDGRLLMHNTRRMRADRDEDILSGMLTAILSFLRDSDPEENGELRRFEIGGKTTLLERGAHVYMAAVYSGRVPRSAGKALQRFMSNLEARFGTALATWTGSPEDLQGLKEFTGKFVSRLHSRPPRGTNGRAT